MRKIRKFALILSMEVDYHLPLNENVWQSSFRGNYIAGFRKCYFA